MIDINTVLGGGIIVAVTGAMMELFRRLSRTPPQVEAEAMPVDERDFPSVAYAYEFVQASYDWSLRRLEANESRLQSLQTIARLLL